MLWVTTLFCCSAVLASPVAQNQDEQSVDASAGSGNAVTDVRKKLQHRVIQPLEATHKNAVKEALIVDLADRTIVKSINPAKLAQHRLSSRSARAWAAVTQWLPILNKRHGANDNIEVPAALEMRLNASGEALFRALLKTTSQGLGLTQVAAAKIPTDTTNIEGLVEIVSPFSVSMQSSNMLMARGNIVKRSDGAVYVRNVQIMSPSLNKRQAPFLQGEHRISHKSTVKPVGDDNSPTDVSEAGSDDAKIDVSSSQIAAAPDGHSPVSEPIDDGELIVVPLDFEPEQGSFTFPLKDVDGDEIVEIDGKKYKVHGSQIVGYELSGTGSATFHATVTSHHNEIYTQPIEESVTVTTQEIHTHTVKDTVTVTTQDVSTRIVENVVTITAHETLSHTVEATVTVTTYLEPIPVPTVVDMDDQDDDLRQIHHLWPQQDSAEITVSGADGHLTVIHPATQPVVITEPTLPPQPDWQPEPPAEPAPPKESKAFIYFEPLTGDHVHAKIHVDGTVA